jgi:hypothetical protein
MSKLMVAVHEINYLSAGKPKIAVPGSVFEPNPGDFDFLSRAGAIREPTESEIALYERVTGRRVEAAPSSSEEAAPVDKARRRGRPRKEVEQPENDQSDLFDKDDII